MSTRTTPQETTLPHRTSSMNETTSSNPRASMSDDETIPEEDSSEVTKLLVERLRALKHVCGYVENYVTASARAQKSQSKDYERVLKVCIMCFLAMFLTDAARRLRATPSGSLTTSTRVLEVSRPYLTISAPTPRA